MLIYSTKINNTIKYVLIFKYSYAPSIPLLSDIKEKKGNV